MVLSFASAVLLLPEIAAAHTRSETYSSWTISGTTVRLTFTVPEVEARRISQSGVDTPTDRQLGDYLKDRLLVAAEGTACSSAADVAAEGAAPGFHKFDFMFECPSDRDMKIGSSAFYDLVPTHTNLAQVRTNKGEFIDQLLTRDRHVLEVSGEQAESKLESAGFLEYVMMGITHIFTGLDHQFFLLGLMLISRRFRDLAFVVTGFTLGHSITLALAVTGVLRPQAQYIDTLVALTIALIGAENVAAASGKTAPVVMGLVLLFGIMLVLRLANVGNLPPALLLGTGIFAGSYLVLTGKIRDGAYLRLVVTLVFGLIHGFGFASDLLEMRLPTDRLVELLVGFNLGVEVGQLTLVLVILGIVAILSRLRLTLPRQVVVDVASAVLVGVGLFWFVSRGGS